MKIRRIAAALLAAATFAAGLSLPAYAETAKSETVTVAYEASAKAWDGKAKMKENTAYTLSKSATISTAVSIPKGASLTVKSGAKLTIGEKGSLTVNGTLTIQKGATLVVNGKLTVENTKTLKCGGTMTLGKKASLKISGRYYLLSTGKLSGTPAKVAFDKTAAVVMAGKNSSKTFATAVNKLYAAQQKSSVAAGKKGTANVAKKELSEHYNRYLKILFTDKAYMHSLKALYSDADIKMVMDVYEEAKKTNVEAFLYENIDTFSGNVLKMFSLDNLSDVSKLKSISVTIDEVYDCSSLVDINTLKDRFGNVTQFWGADATYNFTLKDGTKHKTSNAYIYFVYADGKLMLVSELLNDASYK